MLAILPHLVALGVLGLVHLRLAVVVAMLSSIVGLVVAILLLVRLALVVGVLLVVAWLPRLRRLLIWHRHGGRHEGFVSRRLKTVHVRLHHARCGHWSALRRGLEHWSLRWDEGRSVARARHEARH